MNRPNEGKVNINYQTRDIDMVSLSPAEIDLLSELSLPFQICLALSTTFLGAAITLFIAYRTTDPGINALMGYGALTAAVSGCFGLIAWILHKTNKSYKEKILKREV